MNERDENPLSFPIVVQVSPRIVIGMGNKLMAYFSSPIRKFKCDSCGAIETFDVREDERGLFKNAECDCGSLMSSFSDPNSEPLEEEDLDNLPSERL